MNKDEFKQAHPKALALPAYKYLKREEADILHDEMIEVWMGHSAITRATSQYPVIGTDGLDPCGGLIIYDPALRMAACMHGYPVTAEDFHALCQKMQSDVSDAKPRPLKVWVLGGNNAVMDAPWADKPYYGSYADEMRESMHELLSAIEQRPNCRLMAYDVDTKKHPAGAFIDTRNGRVMRTSKDILVQHDKNLADPEMIVHWFEHEQIQCTAKNDDPGFYDYTKQDMQLKSYKQRRPATLKQGQEL